MSAYIDGFIVPVPKKKLAAYRRMARKFDALWLKEDEEDINLMKYPLRQRKEILNKIVKERPGILEIVKYQ